MALIALFIGLGQWRSINADRTSALEKCRRCTPVVAPAPLTLTGQTCLTEVSVVADFASTRLLNRVDNSECYRRDQG